MRQGINHNSNTEFYLLSSTETEREKKIGIREKQRVQKEKINKQKDT